MVAAFFIMSKKKRKRSRSSSSSSSESFLRFSKVKETCEPSPATVPDPCVEGNSFEGWRPASYRKNLWKNDESVLDKSFRLLTRNAKGRRFDASFTDQFPLAQLAVIGRVAEAERIRLGLPPFGFLSV